MLEVSSVAKGMKVHGKRIWILQFNCLQLANPKPQSSFLCYIKHHCHLQGRIRIPLQRVIQRKHIEKNSFQQNQMVENSTAERNRFSPNVFNAKEINRHSFSMVYAYFFKKNIWRWKNWKIKYLILHCQMMGVIDTNILFIKKKLHRKRVSVCAGRKFELIHLAENRYNRWHG